MAYEQIAPSCDPLSEGVDKINDEINVLMKFQDLSHTDSQMCLIRRLWNAKFTIVVP